jgi:hypothetical protein
MFHPKSKNTKSSYVRTLQLCRENEPTTGQKALQKQSTKVPNPPTKKKKRDPQKVTETERKKSRKLKQNWSKKGFKLERDHRRDLQNIPNGTAEKFKIPTRYRS